MAPIHETDEAQERWSEAEWKQYELWEKIEVRFRKKRRLWIALTVLVFLLISSIPIVKENGPRWAAVSAARRLGQEIDRLKRDAGLTAQAYRIRFRGQGSPIYDIEQSARCSDPSGVIVRSGTLQKLGAANLALLSRSQGEALRVTGLSETLCYDSLSGLEPSLHQVGETPIVGFGLIPQEDVATAREDRLVVLLVSGVAAEISYD